MKIGLISTQFAVNYGAVLQAYSLSRFINDLDSVDSIETINYQPKLPRYGNVEFYSFDSLKSFIISLAKLFNVSYRNARIRKIQKFDIFVKIEFNLSNIFLNSKDLQDGNFDYDLAIVGSDQVWNHNVIKDDIFYLNFLDCSKLSYAASLGGTVDQKSLEILSQRIKNFKAISLREKDGVDFLERALNKNIKILIDPVFLTSKEYWFNLASKSYLNINEKYALVYEVNSPPNFKNYVEKLKKIVNFPIIVISTKAIPKYIGVKTISDAGPYDFVNVLSKATFILTSSFHGLAFSCIFNKQFACVLNSQRSERQHNLLQIFKLEENIVSSEDDLLKCITRNNDWDKVNEKIKDEIEKSKNFLIKGITNV